MTVVSGLVIIVLFTALSAAKLAAVGPMRTAAAHLGFTVTQYRIIGVLELAAVIGIGVGFGKPLLGILAAVGLLLLLAGAAIAHLTAHDKPARIVVPVAVAAVIVTYIVGIS
jgi:hypothetical protein